MSFIQCNLLFNKDKRKLENREMNKFSYTYKIENGLKLNWTYLQFFRQYLICLIVND